MAVSEVGVRRITNTRLIDHDGLVKHGNFLLHEDGNYSESNGDEDVIEEIDGSTRLITRSFQNWHTHLPMILNRGMGEGLPLMEWLEKSIFPVYGPSWEAPFHIICLIDCILNNIFTFGLLNLQLFYETCSPPSVGSIIFKAACVQNLESNPSRPPN